MKFTKKSIKHAFGTAAKVTLGVGVVVGAGVAVGTGLGALGVPVVASTIAGTATSGTLGVGAVACKILSEMFQF